MTLYDENWYSKPVDLENINFSREVERRGRGICHDVLISLSLVELPRQVYSNRGN
jgi:hypothetical protein